MFVLDEGIGKPEDGESIHTAKGYTMSVEIVSVTSRIPDRAKEPYYNYPAFIRSLERFGDTPTILGMNEPWGGLMTKARRLRQWLREGRCGEETLIVCDAFDIVFTAPPAEVAERYWNIWPNGELIFNAEKGLFPRAELRARMDAIWEDRWGKRDPDARSWPFKYLNSGFMIGEPAKILSLLESMWLDDIHDDWRSPDALHGGAGTMVNTNDQGHFGYAYCAQVVPIDIDYGCNLCQTTSACEASEFDMTGERVRNIATDAVPLVWHFNGSKEPMMGTLLKHCGLE